MKSPAIALALAAILAAPVAAQEWAGRGRIHGTVKSDDGKPLAGARVQLIFAQSETGPEVITTSSKGRWSMLGLASGQWNVLVDAEGYKGAQASIRVYESGPGQSLDIELRKPTAEERAAAAAAERGSAVERLKKGNELVGAKQYAEARAEYESALADLPPENHPPVLRAIANTWYAEGNVDQAVAVFDRALALVPDDPELLQAAVNVLVAAGRESDAQAYLARLPADAELNSTTLLNFGIDAYNNGEMEEAFGHFDRLVTQKPDYPDGYYYRGLVNLNKGNNDAAAADFRRFLELAPDHAKANEAREFLSYLES